jgi:uracil-DNA glycosylase family 4
MPSVRQLARTAPSLTRAYDPPALGARCDICPLKNRTVVPPAPAKRPVRLAIVGEAPGYMEENRREPFIGKSGRMLDVVLRDGKVSRDSIHITNAALCRGEWEEGPAADAIRAQAIACCAPRLGRELGALPPHVPILALGAKAIRPLLGKGAINRVRGFVWTAPTVTEAHVTAASRNLTKWTEKGEEIRIKSAEMNLAIAQGRRWVSGRTVFATVHPAHILRGADAWAPIFRLDVERALHWAFRGHFPLEDDEPYIETHTPERAAWHLKRMGPVISLDIETGGPSEGRNPLLADITCIGVSDSQVPGQGRSLVMSPWHPRLVPVLNEALKNRVATGHNIVAFDKICCEKHGIQLPQIEDSLIAHHAYASHMPQSLAHVGSVYCRIGPWKNNFRDTEKGLAGFGIHSDELSKYNAADVRIQFRSWGRMQEDLDPERHVYELDMRVAEMCANMQRVGIAIDDARRIEVAEKLRRKAARLLAKMRFILRRKTFEPAKTAHIRKALYSMLKVPVRKDRLTKTGLPSTGAALLASYADFPTRAGRFCRALIDWRAANDTVSEYLDGESFRETIIKGRVHASWRSFGTEVGRPATHRPNILNMPRLVLTDRAAARLAKCKTKEERAAVMDALGREAYDPATRVREIYVAKPGHRFIYFDLSQSQMRQAAHLSGDKNFMNSCKGDVHTENACLLFPHAEEKLRKDPKGLGKKYRDIVKNIGFAILFLAEEDKVYITLQAAGFTEITPAECAAIIRAIRKAYPQYAAYVMRNQALCARDGYLRSPYVGRIRRMGHHAKPTTVANYPNTSGEADIMMMRLLEIEERRPASSPLVMWAYDAAVYEVPESEIDYDDKGLPTGELPSLIKSVWDQPIVVPHNKVVWKQPIDMKVGDRLSDL